MGLQEDYELVQKWKQLQRSRRDELVRINSKNRQLRLKAMKNKLLFEGDIQCRTN